MKDKQNDEQPAGRRLRKAVDGPIIEKWYARIYLFAIGSWQFNGKGTEKYVRSALAF